MVRLIVEANKRSKRGKQSKTGSVPDYSGNAVDDVKVKRQPGASKPTSSSSGHGQQQEAVRI